jgi:acid stress-induced BolA-like protein IbaG/YrbA
LLFDDDRDYVFDGWLKLEAKGGKVLAFGLKIVDNEFNGLVSLKHDQVEYSALIGIFSLQKYG